MDEGQSQQPAPVAPQVLLEESKDPVSFGDSPLRVPSPGPHRTDKTPIGR